MAKMFLKTYYYQTVIFSIYNFVFPLSKKYLNQTINHVLLLLNPEKEKVKCADVNVKIIKICAEDIFPKKKY